MTTTYTGEIRTVIPNKYLACKPFKTVENKSSVFSSWELKNPLVELEVVFQDKEKEYIPGSLVYVRPFLEQPHWIKDVFTLNGQEIILVPKDFIVGYKYVEETKATAVPSWPDYVKWPTVYGPYGTTGQTTSYTITWTSGDSGISCGCGPGAKHGLSSTTSAILRQNLSDALAGGLTSLTTNSSPISKFELQDSKAWDLDSVKKDV
jgi:hypothetical protein